MATRITRFILMVFLSCVIITPAEASLSRRSVLVYDANTNRVIYEKDGYAERYPASLTKMMTLYMLFDALSTGKVNFNTRMTASRYAASQPQTNVAMKMGDSITVGQAVNAVVIRSANDVAVVIAEHLGGNTANFAAMMNRKARELGMKNTVFKNPNGLPDPRQHTTPMDLALLGAALRKHFPQYYHVFSLPSFSYKGVVYTSHNRVLGKLPGIDGIKTGFINASGFNLVTSLKRGGINIVAVIMGGTTAAERDAQMVALLRRTYTAMAAGQPGAGQPIRGMSTTQVADVNAPIPIAKPVLVKLQPAKIIASESVTQVEPPKQTMAPTVPDPSTLQAAALPSAIAVHFVNEPTPTEGNSTHIQVSTQAASPKAAVASDKHTLGYQFAAASKPLNEQPAAPQPLPSPSKTAPADTANNWAIQIGVYSDKTSARKALSTIAGKVRPELSTAVAEVEYAEQANRGFHRARFRNLARDEATNVCMKLQRMHQDCFVTRVN